MKRWLIKRDKVPVEMVVTPMPSGEASSDLVGKKFRQVIFWFGNWAHVFTLVRMLEWAMTTLSTHSLTEWSISIVKGAA